LREATVAGVGRGAVNDAKKKLKVFEARVRRSKEARLQACMDSTAPDDQYFAALEDAIEVAEALHVSSDKIAAAKKALVQRRKAMVRRSAAEDQLKRLVDMVSSQPSVDNLDALENALSEAAAAGVEDGVVNRASAALSKARREAEHDVRDRLQGSIARIKAAADRGAPALLPLIYSEFPPKKGSPRTLQKIEEAKERGTPAAWKPLLLQAQRDYHPDRNAHQDRPTMQMSQLEWTTLSLSISQHVSAMYTEMFRPRAGPER